VKGLTEFPTKGDNFRTVGPWRILEGEGWRRWRTLAIAAEIAASESRGDMIARARLVLELQATQTEHLGRRSHPYGPSQDLAALGAPRGARRTATTLPPAERASDA